MDMKLLRRSISRIVSDAGEGLHFHAGRLNQPALDVDPMRECLASLEILQKAQRAIAERMAEAYRESETERIDATPEEKEWVDQTFGRPRLVG